MPFLFQPACHVFYNAGIYLFRKLSVFTNKKSVINNDTFKRSSCNNFAQCTKK